MNLGFRKLAWGEQCSDPEGEQDEKCGLKMVNDEGWTTGFIQNNLYH